MFSSLKVYAIIAAILLYTGSVWYVSHRFYQSAFDQERLAIAQEALKRSEANNQLSSELATALVQLNKDRTEMAAKLSKEIHDEIQANSIYRDCRVTDGVRDNLQRRIDLQAGRKPAATVRAIPNTR